MKVSTFLLMLMRQAGALGFLGVLIPEEYGGSGLGYHEYISVIEQISIVDPSIGLSVAAHNSLCTNHIYLFGNDTQRSKWLPKLTSGEHIGAWGLTEHNTGSDAKGMNTTAKKVRRYLGVEWNQEFHNPWKKRTYCCSYCSQWRKRRQSRNDCFCCRTEEHLVLVLEKKKINWECVLQKLQKWFLITVVYPDENRLGAVGEGFIQSMKILDGGRISIGALSLGLAKGAYQASLQYSKERKQFGKPISSFQGISFKLAEMATEIEASELLLHKAASDKNQGKNITKIGAMAKMYASEVCVKVANEAVQIHGGYGFTKDFPVEKFYRDRKALYHRRGNN